MFSQRCSIQWFIAVDGGYRKTDARIIQTTRQPRWSNAKQISTTENRSRKMKENRVERRQKTTGLLSHSFI